LAISKHKAARLITVIRGSLTGMIYDQILRLPASHSRGEVVTAISTDIERMALGLGTYYECWAAPIELGLFFWLIYRELFESSIAAMLLSLGRSSPKIPPMLFFSFFLCLLRSNG
jgi:hypothetical protein